MIAKMSDNETMPFAMLLPIQTIFDDIYTEVYIRFMLYGNIRFFKVHDF